MRLERPKGPAVKPYYSIDVWESLYFFDDCAGADGACIRLAHSKNACKEHAVIVYYYSVIARAVHCFNYKMAGGESRMAQVFVRENESLESALKRFKRSCARDGVMAEVRKREHYEKPSVKRKKKSEAARKKARKY